jgi:hypothetical protein
MSEEIKEVDTYKIFRQLEEKKKRANPYTFYDKDELIDEILKQEDEIERLNNIINELEKWLNEDECFNGRKLRKDYITVLVTDVLDKLKALKEDNNGK